MKVEYLPLRAYNFSSILRQMPGKPVNLRQPSHLRINDLIPLFTSQVFYDAKKQIGSILVNFNHRIKQKIHKIE